MPIVANQSAAEIPEVTETYARSMAEKTVLYIDKDGSWKVGQFGQSISEYKNVTFSTTTKINDLTYFATAIAVGKGDNGGYKLYATFNFNERLMFELGVDAGGKVFSARRLGDADIWAAETRLNLDLNENGGIGAADVLINDSTENLVADANGDLAVKAAAKTISLTVDGAPLNIRDVGDLEFADISFVAGGGLEAYLYSDDGDLYLQAFDAAGRAVGDLQLISTFDAQGGSGLDKGILGSLLADRAKALNTAGNNAEAQSGKDLNRQSDTPLTAGWTEMIKTATIKAVIEKGTANGAKLDHAGVNALLETALLAAGSASTDKVSQSVIDDLRAIASRGKALFTAKDSNGAETGYLAYVFDKIVNDSDANAFYTGGTATKQNLGNLSSDSTVAQLGLLRDKWLLGKDMPNPTTQGDTANPKAAAATGSYKVFSAPLFVDGTQYSDVNQGSAGTCYLLASIANFAHVYGKDIMAGLVSNAVVDGAGRSFGVRFYDLNGGVHWVTANDQLVVSNPDDTSAAYTKVKGVDAKGATVAELWAPLIEKAYAQFNELKLNKREKSDNAFYAIEGGNGEMAMFLLNRSIVAYTDDATKVDSSFAGNPRAQVVKPADGKTALQAYTEALNKGLTMWVGANDTVKDANGKFLVVGSHAHMVIDADPVNPNNTDVIFYNPWGVADENSQHLTPFKYDLAKLVGVAGIDIFVDVPNAPGG